MGEVMATHIVNIKDGIVMLPRGYVPGRELPEDMPEYMQEVAVMQPLRALREWLGAEDHDMIQHVTVRAGDTLTRHRVETWLHGGGCHLDAPKASGIIRELGELREWLRTWVLWGPFYLPEDLASDGVSHAMKV